MKTISAVTIEQIREFVTEGIDLSKGNRSFPSDSFWQSLARTGTAGR